MANIRRKILIIVAIFSLFSPAVLSDRAKAASNDWVFIEAGGQHSLAIKSDGSLWSWGLGSWNRLGHGDGTTKYRPTRVGTDNDWVYVSTAFTHNLALKADGSLWGWGYNSSGQLGLGDTTARGTPVRIGTANDWVYTEASGNSSYAIKSDGSLWSWGNGTSGALGNGSTSGRTVPGRVGTDNDWLTLRASSVSVVAKKTNRTLWAWGANSSGQLGLGHNSSVLSPTQIGSDADWAEAAISSHLLATKLSRELYSTGNNGYGQLGHGDTLSLNLFKKVGTDISWTRLSAGNMNSSYGIKSDGTLWAWGYGGSGKLGLGDTIDRLLPTQVGTDTDWKSVSSGDSHGLALKTDGTIWSWGDGYVGALGHGVNTNELVPRQIITDDPPAFASSSFTASNVTVNSATLNWDTNPQATQYIVKRDGVQIYSGAGITFNDSGLSPNTTYQYELIAQNLGGSSPPMTLNVTTPAARSWNISLGVGNVTMDPIVISGGSQTSAGDLPMITAEHTGTNTDGWNLTAEATPFTEINSGQQLPINSFYLKGTPVITQTSGSSPLPSVQTLNGARDNGAVLLFRGLPAEAEGTFEIQYPQDSLELTVDTSQRLIEQGRSEGIYRSSITFTMSVGP